MFINSCFLGSPCIFLYKQKRPQGRFCLKKNEIGLPLAKAFQTHGPIQRRGFADMLLKVLHYLTRRIKSPDS